MSVRLFSASSSRVRPVQADRALMSEIMLLEAAKVVSSSIRAKIATSAI